MCLRNVVLFQKGGEKSLAESKKVTSVLNEMRTLLDEADKDASKFDDGIRGANAAGMRVRKLMQLLKSRAQEVRQLVSEMKHERN